MGGNTSKCNYLLLALFLVPILFASKQSFSEEEKERLVVVGTRALPRTVLDSSAPIDIISRTEIERSGFADTGKMLDALIPSFLFITPSISDGTDSVKPATLRGLYPDQLLVLINGKRRHSSALVHVNGTVGRGSAGIDFNAIPSSAIERIEVLRDGAAAQYGSDAIAGVINIVLRQEVEETELNASFGQTYDGDGARHRLSFNSGVPIRETGFFHLSIERESNNIVNRAQPDPRQQYSLLGDGSFDPREDTINRINHQFGEPDRVNDYLFFNSVVPLRDEWEFYAFGGNSDRDTVGAGFYRRALDNRNNPNIYPDGFLPKIVTDIGDVSLALGLRGDYAEWDLDASFVYGRNDFIFNVKDSINISLGDNSPTEAFAGELAFSQKTFNLDLNRYMDAMWGQSFHVAIGFEFREDQFELKAGELNSYVDGGFPNQSGGPATPGIQVFPGFRPENEVDEKRQSRALYFDIETDLSEKWQMGIAARYEDYSDFGTDLNGKLSTRYKWTPNFAMRATLATGFRAPSLMQQYFNSISTQSVDVNGSPVLIEVVTARSDSEVVAQIGGERLKEENSWSLSFGGVWTLPYNLSITTDAYYIEVDDRVLLSSPYGRADSPEIAAVLDQHGINRIQFFNNAVDTRTRGLDLNLAWSHKFEHGGYLKTDALANFTKTEVSGRRADPEVLASSGISLIGYREELWLEEGQPSKRYTINNFYRYEDHEINWRLRHYGRVRSAENNSEDTSQTFGSRWLTDIEYGYYFTPKLRFSVGATNLFDTYPEENNVPNARNNGIFLYNRRATQFPITGGVYYTTLKFVF